MFENLKIYWDDQIKDSVMSTAQNTDGNMKNVFRILVGNFMHVGG